MSNNFASGGRILSEQGEEDQHLRRTCNRSRRNSGLTFYKPLFMLLKARFLQLVEVIIFDCKTARLLGTVIFKKV